MYAFDKETQQILNKNRVVNGIAFCQKKFDFNYEKVKLFFCQVAQNNLQNYS